LFGAGSRAESPGLDWADLSSHPRPAPSATDGTRAGDFAALLLEPDPNRVSMNLPAASGGTLVACGLTSLSAVCGSLDALGPAARAERLRRPDAPALERARHDEVCHRASSGNYGAWSKNGTQAGGRRAPGDTSGGDRGVALPDGRGIGPCGRRRAAGQNGGSAESRAASGRYDAAAPSHVSSVTATTRAVLAAVLPVPSPKREHTPRSLGLRRPADRSGGGQGGAGCHLRIAGGDGAEVVSARIAS
jgi:hypothetical protein